MSKKTDLIELDVRIKDCRAHLASGFGVYEVELLASSDSKKDDPFYVGKVDTVSITGMFDRRYHYGEEYFMYGQYFEHPTYGPQYKIQFVENKYDTPDRVRAFLKTLVADNIAEQLIAKYGGDVLQRIVDNEVDYSDIKGMAEIRFNAMREKVLENKYLKEMIISLTDFGITPNQMKNIAKKFGAEAISKINENPYCLCQVYGIGFLKADEVAKRMGFDMKSPKRIDEAVKYVIEQEQSGGNSWVERRKLIREVTDLINVDKAIIADHMDDVPDLHIEGNKITLEKTYNAEHFIACKLREMHEQTEPVRIPDVSVSPEQYLEEWSGEGAYFTPWVNKFLEEVPEKYGMTLTEQQRALFSNFFKSRVNYLVGYAGCGKSALQKILLDMVTRLRMRVLLLAPTGKAAKVLEEYTGRKAYTIHRALRVVEGVDESTEVYEDLVIVDESSMADVYIVAKLLSALKNPQARVLFIGDDFQIPSVGVGNFLHDCIVHGQFPITMLTQVFRQSEGGLLDAVTKLRLGEQFVADEFLGELKMGKDLVIRSVTQKWMEEGYKYYLKKALEQYEIEDIIILSPTKKSNLGTVAINAVVQEMVNPASRNKKEIQHGKFATFRVGDRIINIKNTYKIRDLNAIPTSGDPLLDGVELYGMVDIMNGDIGYIHDIDFDKKNVIVDYGFAMVEVGFNSLDAITHSWALTIHKSQGSGFKCVICIMDKAHKWQLNANLVYTGWTRAREMCYVLCQADVINASMKKVASQERDTFLPDLLTVVA